MTQTSAIDAYVAHQHLQQLQIDVAYVLGDVAATAALVDALTDTTQRRLGFLTPSALEAIDEQARKELRDRLDAQRNGRPTGSGDVATPGNFAGIAVATELWAVLAHAHRRCARHLRSRGVCSLHRMSTDPSPQELARTLGHQILAVTDPRLLETIHRDLVALEETTTRFVNAVESTTALNADCPHCERRTLVVRFHDDEIRCDRDPKTRHYEPCVCSDPLCACKTRPTSYRHAWHRATKQPSWWALRDRLNLTRVADDKDVP